VLAVKRVLALHNSGVAGIPQLIRGLAECDKNIGIGNGRKFKRGILAAGPVLPHRARGNNYVAGSYTQHNAAAGADPDKGVHAAGRKLLNRNSGRGSTNAG